MTVKKAIIAVAGYGTRRLPITKSIEKCMLPLLNRPVIDYIVEDCVKAGVEDIYIVINDDSKQIREYYTRNEELEKYLRRKNRADLIASITPPDVRIHYIAEKRKHDTRYGTTTPVWAARKFIDNDEPFYVIMGDNCLWSPEQNSQLLGLAQKVEASGADAGIIGVKIDPRDVEQYGVIDRDENQLFRGIVDRPAVEDAPSNLINPSMYLFPARFLRNIERQMAQDLPGEYGITDVINDFANEGNDVVVYETAAKYLDCGDLARWVEANSWLMGQVKGQE